MGARRLSALAMVGIIAACSTAPTVGPVAPGATGLGATTGSPATPAPPLGQPVEPAAAARAVLQATSDEDRERAIADIFAGVGIGIYTTDGQPIQVGAERSADDFFAYDWEIEGLAIALRDGDQVWLSDIAAGVAEIGLIDPGDADATSLVKAALSTAVAEALANPSEPPAYPLLVAQQLSLGAADPIDLRELPANGDVALDPLAGFLVAADVVLPTIQATPPGAVAALLRTASLDGGPPAVRLAAGSCPSQIQGQGGWRAGQTQLSGPGGANAASLPYLQMRLANSSVEVDKQALPGGALPWHYRHDRADNQPRGYKLVFKLRITPTSDAIRCGVFAGSTLPQDKILAGVPVTWQYDDFEPHGTADCPAVGCAATDTQGASTFGFLPRLEQDPVGIGPEQRADGVVRAHWNVGQSLAPELASIIRNAGYASFGWASHIKYHRPYEVTMELASDIYIVEALGLIGHVADAHAEGTLDVSSVRAGSTQSGNCSGGFCVGPVFEIQNLTVDTTAATDGPKCRTPHVTVDGPRAEIDWIITDAVIYPASEIRVRMDSGPDIERIDKYTYVPCVGGNQVSPPGTAAWEHYVLRSRVATGLVFEGLKVGTASGPGWEYIADQTPAVWQQGGVVAIWDAAEGCGGSCDPTKSRIKLILKVRPLPFP